MLSTSSSTAPSLFLFFVSLVWFGLVWFGLGSCSIHCLFTLNCIWCVCVCVCAVCVLFVYVCVCCVCYVCVCRSACDNGSLSISSILNACSKTCIWPMVQMMSQGTFKLSMANQSCFIVHDRFYWLMQLLFTHTITGKLKPEDNLLQVLDQLILALQHLQPTQTSYIHAVCWLAFHFISWWICGWWIDLWLMVDGLIYGWWLMDWWLMDGFMVDGLIDGLMDWWIDWWIDGLMDWLMVDGLIYGWWIDLWLMDLWLMDLWLMDWFVVDRLIYGW